MKMKYRIVCVLCVLLVISACGKKGETAVDANKHIEETKGINEGDYSALLPFLPSDAGQKHVQMAQLYGDLSDTLAIGTGLMERSKEYFSPKNYAFRGGVYLDFDALDASSLAGDRIGLLGRTSTRNTIGLNPKVGDIFQTDKGDMKITDKDILVYDIFEYDWYKSKELKGLSIALVLNDKLGSDDNPATINMNKLLAYGEEAAVKVVNYLRKSKPEIGDSMPIYVTLFNASKPDKTLPGRFIAEAYFTSNINANFREVNEIWALFPTKTAVELDNTTATYFSRYKASFKEFLNQDVDIIGKGHFLNNELKSLQIDVSLYAKSADEVLAGIQLLNERLTMFTSTSFKISVIIKSDNKQVATIIRNKGTNRTDAQILI